MRILHPYQTQNPETDTKVHKRIQKECVSQTCQVSSNLQELLSCVNEEISQMQLFQK